MPVNLNSITPVGPGWKRLPSEHRGYPRWRHESGVEAELYRDEGNGYLWVAELWNCEDGAEEEAWALIRAAFPQQRAPEAPDDKAADGYVSPLANDPEYARMYAEEGLNAEMGEALARCMLVQGVTRSELVRRLQVSPARVRRLFDDCKDARLWAGALHVLGYKAELMVVGTAAARAPALPADVPRHLLIACMQFQQALRDDTVRSLNTTNEYLQPIVDAALIWREKAVEQARRRGQLAVLCLGAGTPFWLLDVFQRLLDSVEDRAAVEAGMDLLAKMLDILEAATAAEAAAAAEEVTK